MMLINGQPGELVSAFDRGLQYGDGLFETIAVRDSAPLLFEHHLRRLAEGCRRMRLPEPDPTLLTGEARTLCDDAPRAVLKIIVTRGPGRRGYRIATDETPASTRIVMRLPAPPVATEDYRHGVALRLCETRLGANPALAGIKHLNRLEQVLARAEWDDPEIREGLMMDREGAVIEGTMSNLFIVSAGKLRTPALGDCGVAGILRAQVLETAAALGIAAAETRLLPGDVGAADEAFVCNSLIGVVPVRRFERTELAVGPVTRRLMAALGRHSLAPGDAASA